MRLNERNTKRHRATHAAVAVSPWQMIQMLERRHEQRVNHSPLDDLNPKLLDLLVRLKYGSN